VYSQRTELNCHLRMRSSVAPPLPSCNSSSACDQWVHQSTALSPGYINKRAINRHYYVSNYAEVSVRPLRKHEAHRISLATTGLRIRAGLVLSAIVPFTLNIRSITYTHEHILTKGIGISGLLTTTLFIRQSRRVRLHRHRTEIHGEEVVRRVHASSTWALDVRVPGILASVSHEQSLQVRKQYTYPVEVVGRR
jgi:hypothetical protein